VRTPELTLTPPKNDKFWQGSTTCDHCDNQIKGDLFDVRSYSGQWGTFCLPCAHRNSPMKMGTGSGQHYKQTTDGKWLKVAG